MPLHSDIVGAATEPMAHQVDARWLMAYAAALGDLNPLYMDTQANTVIAHPVFPVCPEWPVILDTRNMRASEQLTAEESARGVHAAHDLHIYRPIKAGDHITTKATMIGARAIRPGAAYTMRLDTVDAVSGDLLARTYQLGIYRGVAVAGGDASIETPPELPDTTPFAAPLSQEIFVAEGAAHTYTECARIWNPIHTDRSVALGAGLPDIILHGTATLALAVSRIINEYAGGDPRRVRRLGGRFSAMVLMPSTITLRSERQGDVIAYQVLTEDGDPAISNGFVCLSEI